MRIHGHRKQSYIRQYTLLLYTFQSGENVGKKLSANIIQYKCIIRIFIFYFLKMYDFVEIEVYICMYGEGEKEREEGLLVGVGWW